jgi:N-acetylglucosamine kinase-like BadF-type ATPase
MQSGTRRLIHQAVDEQAVAWNVKHGYLRRVRGIGWRIGEDGSGNRLGDGGARGCRKNREDEDGRGALSVTH